MRINVFYDRRKMRIWIPDFLLMNGICAEYISKKSKNTVNLNSEQWRIVFKTIRKAKKRYKRWKLAEIKENGKTVVEIIL